MSRLPPLQVIEQWNSANVAIHYGREAELPGSDREAQEISMLTLHLHGPVRAGPGQASGLRPGNRNGWPSVGTVAFSQVDRLPGWRWRVLEQGDWLRCGYAEFCSLFGVPAWLRRRYLPGAVPYSRLKAFAKANSEV